jgi:hypothetical protein
VGRSKRAIRPNLDNAIIRVGDGRGFLVKLSSQQWQGSPVVITAAHCLPFIPEPDRGSNRREYTYKDLLGARGEQPPHVWATCLSVDPINDVAVLCEPDIQALGEHAAAYTAFVEPRSTLTLDMITEPTTGWVLTLDGWLAPCTIDVCGFPAVRSLWVSRRFDNGLSGSPILTTRGRVVGIVSSARVNESPALLNILPTWMLSLRELVLHADGREESGVRTTRRLPSRLSRAHRTSGSCGAGRVGPQKP